MFNCAGLPGTRTMQTSTLGEALAVGWSPLVEVVWLTRHVRADWVAEHGSVVRPIEQWLQSRGGSGGVRSNRRASGSPYREWLWSVDDQQVSNWDRGDRVPITGLTPVTVSEVDVAESWGINGHGGVVLVDEPLQWWLNAEWRVPETEWVFPRDRVVGLQFRDHSTNNRQVTKAQQAWLKSLHTQSHCWTQSPLSIPVLYSYSDCSLDRVDGYVRVSYGWVTAGVANQHLVREVGAPGSGMWRLDPGESAWDLATLEKGTWGGGVVDGPKEDHSTFRGEAFGLLATLVWLEGSEWQGRLEHRLDNEAVVNKYNADDALYTDYERCVYADPDVWAALFSLKARMGNRVKVLWQRSHPERRLARAMWDRHDRGNDMSDSQADRAMETFKPSDRRLQLVAPEEQGWGITWLGQMVVCDVRRIMMAALKVSHLRQHLIKNRTWDPATVELVSAERWVGRMSQVRDQAAATLVNKMLFGWLASMSVMARRGSKEALLTRQCRLGCDAEETNWHVLAECKHNEVVRERRRCVAAVHQLVATMDVSDYAKKIMGLSWALDAEGCVRDRSTEEGMQELVSGWAPELEDVAVELHQRLGWDKEVGSHHDQLWKMSFKGLMLDNWVTVLGDLGIKKAKAHAMLQQVEKAIAGTLTGVWKVFTEEAHEANAGTTKREARHQDIRDMMATLAEAGRPVARHKELWLFNSPSATQRKWLRNKRKLELKPRGGRQQTLSDCGIGPRAQGAGPEAPRRCLEHDAIDRMSEQELRAYWGRTQQTEVCSECGVDVVTPVEERMTHLCGEGWEMHVDLRQHVSQGQTDPLEQAFLSGELMDMGSQLGPQVGDSAGIAANASDRCARRADRAMQAGADNQAARVPPAGARVPSSGSAEDGGARDSSAVNAAGRVTGQLAAQVCEGSGHHSEGRGSVLGMGGDREHTGMAPADRRETTARGRCGPAGVAGSGSGDRRVGTDDEEGRLSVVCNLQDAGAGCTHGGRGGAGVPGHAAASPASMGQRSQGSNAGSGRWEAEQRGVQLGTDTAGAAEGGDPDRGAQEADDKEVDGKVLHSGNQSRGAAKGAEAQQGGGCRLHTASEGRDHRPVCRQAVYEETCQTDGLQVHSGGAEGSHQGCEGQPEGGCGDGLDGSPTSPAACCDSRAGGRAHPGDQICVGISAVRDSVEAGPQQPEAHSPQGVLQGQQRGVQAEGGGGDRRHEGASDRAGRGPRHNDCISVAGTGCSLQPVRHSLGSGESQRPTGQEASAAVADEEWQGEVWQGQLLPVRSHLCQRHMCEDDSAAVDTEGEERYRDVQEGDRQLLSQDRVFQPADTQVEPPQHDRRQGSQVSEGALQGRGAEQGATEAVAGDPAGTAEVRRPRAARARRRKKPKSRARRKTGETTKGGPEALCQLMGAQAGHHRLMSVVPATDGGNLDTCRDLEQLTAEMQPD